MANSNALFLAAISEKVKGEILESIASHYCISPEEVYTECCDLYYFSVLDERYGC